MVYYGALSKGCQRCRRRKIKACRWHDGFAANPSTHLPLTCCCRQCDARKPACLRCERSGIQCPGYRDLGEILFRDESERVARWFCDAAQSEESPSTQQVLAVSAVSPRIPAIARRKPAWLTPGRVAYSISQPAVELGTCFFFAKYLSKEAPFSGEYCDWVSQSYSQGRPSHALRATIEAVGMAGMSNVSHAPLLASRSKQRYCEALAAVKLDLADPVQAAADATLMAVILLGLFEVIIL